MGIQESDTLTADVYQRLEHRLRDLAHRQWGDNQWPLTTGEQQAADDMCAAMTKALLAEFDMLPKGELKQVWHVSRAPLQYSDQAAARRSALASRERLYTQRQTGWKEVEL